jgi:hypothetical protein
VFVLSVSQVRTSELTDEMHGRMKQPAGFHAMKQLLEDLEMHRLGDVLQHLCADDHVKMIWAALQVIAIRSFVSDTKWFERRGSIIRQVRWLFRKTLDRGTVRPVRILNDFPKVFNRIGDLPRVHVGADVHERLLIIAKRMPEQWDGRMPARADVQKTSAN